MYPWWAKLRAMLEPMTASPVTPIWAFDDADDVAELVMPIAYCLEGVLCSVASEVSQPQRSTVSHVGAAGESISEPRRACSVRSATGSRRRASVPPRSRSPLNMPL
ncbi:Uncharacterised protein [Mycobacteroides abscessus subsp. abscessus]|nr:Uncharacterised protein [Mycobacteroides abscessus subsp. abscessus]